MAARNLFADDITEEVDSSVSVNLFSGATPSPERFEPEPFKVNEAEPEPISKVAGISEGVLSGAALGFSDELQALIGAFTSGGLPDSDITGETNDFAQRYKSIRDGMRANSEQFREESPVSAYGSEIVGGLTTGLAGLAKTGSIKGAAVVGGLEGVIAGAGFADAEEFVSGETGESAGVGAGLGVTAGIALPILGRIAKEGGKALIQSAKDLFPNATGLRARFVQQMATPEGLDDDMARYIMNGAGKIETDPLFKPAIKQGFQPGDLAAIQGATPSDKVKFLEMVDKVKRGIANRNFARQNRPGDVAGNTFIERINFVRDVNKQAGKEIGAIARELRGTQINMSKPLQEFSTSMDDLGIQVSQTNGKLKVNFDNSILSPGDRGPVREVIRQVARVVNKASPDALDYHQLKRAIDNNVTWGSSDSLTHDASSLLKGLRTGLDDTLDVAFPDYNNANKVYKETIEALDAVVSHVGKKINLDSDNVNKQLGTELRVLMGNRKTRTNLMDAIKLVEDTARNQGSKFDDSITAQAYFVDSLEDVFGPSAQTSFRADIGKAVVDAGKRNRTAVGAVTEGAMDIAEKGLEIAEGVNQEAAFSIIEQILKR